MCSYLLIGFWFEKKSAARRRQESVHRQPRSATIAFMLGICCSSVALRHARLPRARRRRRRLPLELGPFGVLSIARLLLFIGATGKSAQIPLYVWLPDAMEGPTPVSALIHAATMVTAGVYMVARNAVLFARAGAMLVVAIIGALTASLAATIGLVQNDIKKRAGVLDGLAAGLHVLALGVGAFGAGIFH